MSLKDLNGRHLYLVSTFSTRYAVRGGTGLVYLLLVLSMGLLVAQVFISPIEQIQAKLKREQGAEVETGDLLGRVEDEVKPAVEWFLARGSEEDSDEVRIRKEEDAENWAQSLLQDRPSLLSAILVIMLFSVPFLVAVGCFNLYSGDVQSRGIRYQLLRTERANIFFGRFLGSALYSAVVMGFLVLTISLYLGLKLQVYETQALVTWSVWGFLALATLTLPYIALAGWISSLIDSPFGSLTVTSLIVGGVPLLATLGKMRYEQADYVKYLLPWGFQTYLLHFEWTYAVLAGVGCLFYTALFLALGYVNFSRRDL